MRASEKEPSAPWNLLYSTGKSFNSFPFIFERRPTLDGDDGGIDANHLMVADLNGDGKSDVWQSLDDASGGLHSLHIIYYSNGMPASWQNSTAVFTTQTFSRPESINKHRDAQTIYADINGDSKADMFSLNGTSGRFIYPKPFKEDRLMVKSTDGLGNQTSYNYSLIDKDESLYQRSSTYQYDDPNTPPGQQINGNPYMVIKWPVYALSTVTSPDGIGGITTTAYTYKDAMLSSRGLVFKELVETNYNTGSVQTTYSDIDANLLVPHVTRQTASIGGTIVSEVNITDTFTRVNPINYFDKRYISRVTKRTNKNALTGAVTESTNTYDKYNNVIKNVTSKGYINQSGLFSATETATTTTVFGIHGTPVPAVPESVTSSNVTFNVSNSKTTAYTFDTKGNVLTATDFLGTPIATTTTNTYDDFGNITKVVISAPNTLTPEINYTYDGSGRYLLQKETVGSGTTKTEKFTYDLYFGLVATASSSDGLKTSYTYDGFGRRIKTTLPDGNTITETIGWETAGGARYSTVSERVVDGGLYNKVYYDLLGRKAKSETAGFNSQILTATTIYNYKGQIASQTEPKYASEPTITTTNTYDDYGRLTNSSTSTSSVSVSYAILPGGLYKVTTTNGAEQSSSKTYNAAGRVFYTNDNGGQLNFTYAGWGYQTSVKIGGATLVSSVYDAYGRQTSLTDKNAGTIKYEYDALGRITKQTDAKGNVSTLVYDAFGRVTSQTGPVGTTTYEYYKDLGTGKCNDNITKITGFAGDVTSYEYDNLGRRVSESVIVDGLTFTKTMAYDSYGNLIKTTYPSGVIINDTYDKNGILTKTTMGSGTPTTLFTATAMNSKGVYTRYSYGNGKASTITYDLVKGTPTRYFTAAVQDLNLNFDGQTGNLLSRNDAIIGHTETFTYDNLNRLTSAKVDGVTQFNMTYDAIGGASLGNIKSKSDIGNYTYKTDKINAIAYITSIAGGQTPPGVISQNQQDITYTPFLKAATLSESGYVLSYTYGQDQQRIKGVLNQGANEIETKYYLGAFERQKKGGITRDIHYINAGNGLCAIIVKEGATITPYFVYSDHLGSILAITNNAGTIVAQQNFDAWGRNRNPATWTYTSVPTVPDWLYRGFTGHEHLPQFALINMNGRMYDPATGRMISPDNYVQSPYYSQSFNRYTYCFNNPLKFIDPTGMLTQQQWDDFMRRSQEEASGSGKGFGDNGGYYSSNGSGQFNPFGSQSEAFGAGVAYMNQFNGWGQGLGWTSSPGQALNNFNGGYVNAGMVQGYYQQAWSNTGRYNINAYNAGGVHTEQGFNVTYNAFDSDGLFGGVMFLSRNDAKRLILGDQSYGGWDAAYYTAGAFALANGTKHLMLEGGAALNRGMQISKVNNVSMIRTYGASGAKYLKFSKGLGVAGAVVTTGYSATKVYDQFMDGGTSEVLKNRDILDFGVGAVGIGAAFMLSNPIGWGIGVAVLLYGGGTLIYDAINER